MNFKLLEMGNLIAIMMSVFLGYSCNNNDREGELYNLPEGFRGVVVVIYDQEDGEEKEYFDPKTKDGVKLRVYNIPENGVLKTKFSPNLGEAPTTAIRVFYDFFDESNRKEIKISGHDFMDEGYDIIKAQSFHYGHYCFPNKIPFTSFEVGNRSDFVSEDGEELLKWRGYVEDMIEKYTGVTCEQESVEGGQSESINFSSKTKK